MSSNKQLIARIFKAGLGAAKSANPGPASDGGTCNLDKVAVRFPRIRQSTIESAAQIAEVDVYRFHWFGEVCYWVGVGEEGQGFQRTTMVEAAAKAMTAEIDKLAVDWTAAVYYQMD